MFDRPGRSTTQEEAPYLYLPPDPPLSPIRSAMIVGLLAACVLFNFFLCFANTNLFSTNATTAMIAEALLLSFALFLILIGSVRNLYLTAALLGILLVYFVILYAGRLAIDPKPFRDLAIPIIFLMLGRAYPITGGFNRLVQGLTLLVLGVGLIEYFFAAEYVKYFDLLRYYIAKGATDASAADFIKDGLNINGQRPLGQGRELLPWLLSGHRASSVFLEPVTAGNFGAIVAAWFLAYSKSIMRAFPWLIAAASIIVLADGRFGMMLFFLAVLAFAARRFMRVELTAIAPFAVVTFLIFNYIFFGDKTFPNTFSGRLDYAAHLFTKFDTLDILGLTTHRPYYDSGFAYAVTQFGLIGSLALWATLGWVLLSRARCHYIVNFYLIYISLALMTSGSLYSIKASALMWFVVGMILSPLAGQVHHRPTGQYARELQHIPYGLSSKP